MMTQMSKLRKIEMVLFLSAGFSPFLVGWIMFLFGDYLSWSQEYHNEQSAWCLFLIFFFLLVLYYSFRYFRFALGFCIWSALLACFGIWNAISCFDYAWRRSSKMDDEGLHLLEFWFGGGGLFCLFFIVPISIVYVTLFISRKLVESKNRGG